jgi:hypothetical protein
MTNFYSWITRVANQVQSYMYGVLLCEANMMMSLRAPCYFRNFKMGVMNNSVSNMANASLTALDPSQLFNKRIVISVTISCLGRMVFKFALEKSSEGSS